MSENYLISNRFGEKLLQPQIYPRLNIGQDGSKEWSSCSKITPTRACSSILALKHFALTTFPTVLVSCFHGYFSLLLLNCTGNNIFNVICTVSIQEFHIPQRSALKPASAQVCPKPTRIWKGSNMQNTMRWGSQHFRRLSSRHKMNVLWWKMF